MGFLYYLKKILYYLGYNLFGLWNELKNKMKIKIKVCRKNLICRGKILVIVLK